jgi:hypothetical protein
MTLSVMKLPRKRYPSTKKTTAKPITPFAIVVFVAADRDKFLTPCDAPLGLKGKTANGSRPLAKFLYDSQPGEGKRKRYMVHTRHGIEEDHEGRW